MSPEEYKERAKGLRDHMEERIEVTPWAVGIRTNYESAYLPGGYEKSTKPIPPPDINEDLSYMNPKRGAKGGRPRKKR